MTEKEILNEITSGCVGAEALAFVRSKFKHIESEDNGNRVWTSIYPNGCDEKYGRTMVCLDTREYRSTDFTEFYAGPGVFDYTKASGSWCRHRNHPKLQQYVIPRPGERFDFRQFPIELGIVD